MPAFDFLWAEEIVEHLAEHGISQDDFEQVVCNPASKPCVWGYTEDGRYILAVYEEVDAITLLPVTASEVPEPH